MPKVDSVESNDISAGCAAEFSSLGTAKCIAKPQNAQPMWDSTNFTSSAWGMSMGIHNKWKRVSSHTIVTFTQRTLSLQWSTTSSLEHLASLSNNGLT